MGGFSGGGGSSGIAIGDAVSGGTANSILFVDGSGDLAEDNADFIFDGDHVRLKQQDDAATPTFGFGDGDTGLYESADDTIEVATGGVVRFRINSLGIEGDGSAGFSSFSLMNEVASATNPTLVPRSPDYATGIGSSGTGVVNIISGGVTQITTNTNGNHVIDSILDVATGDEIGLTVSRTVNKATSGDDTGVLIDMTDTASPGVSSALVCATGGTVFLQAELGGKIKIGGTANHASTSGTNHLSIFDGTPPVGTLANGVSFYSSSGEAFVIDAGGTATQLSSHDPETQEWIHHSRKGRNGKHLRIAMERLIRDHFPEYLEEWDGD